MSAHNTQSSAMHNQRETTSPEQSASMSIEGTYLGEFVDQALTGPLPEFQFTVIFRSDTRFAPLIIHGSEIESNNDGNGPTTFRVWSGGGHARRVVGLFNANEIVGIIRGPSHQLQTAS